MTTLYDAPCVPQVHLGEESQDITFFDLEKGLANLPGSA